ncbi:MAG: ATP-binding protein [Verrucomicrobia bacterium]|nr:ATP-binding protein [Verrucomicrobiota bacterium]MBU4291683.1 ATP-binding protein [Verrucomicrobiota bacterium]MBU4430313.1 ATP-binding protein [Verrucomicrobiota bacterium]
MKRGSIVYKRNLYVQKIAPFLGKPVVKVITGMRRSGKSCLVRLLIDKLVADGVRREQIVYVDKESYEFDAIRTYHDLAAHVKAAHPKGGGVCRVFVDEIQEIAGWERIVADWSGRRDIDVVITGSNARLLSGELATLLAGRFVEVQLFPLSFPEFRAFNGLRKTETAEAFRQFLRYGGLPGLHEFGRLADETFRPFVTGVYDTIMLKDIVRRHQVRNYVLLEQVGRYVFDNIGNLTNASRINAFLKSQKLSVGVDTILNYMRWFADAHLTHRVLLYDIKGRRHLEVNEKHYISDLGLRTALIGYRAGDIGGMLENVVCVELLRRGYRVSVGRIGDLEIDFVAERDGRKTYIQVAYLLPSKVTVERESAPLLAVKDNYPKLLLTLDREVGDDYEGVRRLYLPDWLDAGEEGGEAD